MRLRPYKEGHPESEQEAPSGARSYRGRIGYWRQAHLGRWIELLV